MMKKLSIERAAKLDALLATFNSKAHIDREKVLKIEPIESKALALVNILVDQGLATKIGEVEDHDLPLILAITPEAYSFIEDGGFAAELASADDQLSSGYSSHTINNIHVNAPVHGNVFSTGSHSSIDARIENKVGDLESFKKELERLLVSEEDIIEIAEIVSTEVPSKGQPGKKASDWIKKMVVKCATDLWDATIVTAGSVLTEIVKKHYGL